MSRNYSYVSVIVAIIVVLASMQASAAETVSRKLAIEFQGEVYAEKNGSVVTQEQIDAYLSNVPERDRPGVVSDPGRIGKMVDSMMLQQRVVDDADHANLLADPDLSARIYQAATSLIAEEQVRKVLEEAELDSYEERARELYLAKPDMFMSEPSADFTHVLVSTSDKSDFEAVRIVSEILDKLESGRDFDELVLEYSDDPSVGDNKGSFDNTPRGDLTERFANTLFELEVGEISDPVRTQYGWHIIRLDEMIPPERMEFKNVKEKARRMARDRHLDRVRSEYYEDLVAGEISIAEGATEKLLNRYTPDRAARQ